MKPLVIADENIPGVSERLAGMAEVRLLPGREINARHLSAATALLVRSVTRVDEGLLGGTPVTFVGTATSGFDHIDRAWLSAQGIGFAHAPGSNANSVVEYVLAAMAETDDFLERVLSGDSIGIAGYGHIGRCLAARLKCLGISCRVYDPWLDAGDIPCSGSFDEILGCTVISLHTSLTVEQPFPSVHLVDDNALAGIGRGQLLINAARGPVVDNSALLHRLQSADAPSVVLDVWEREPDVDAQLLSLVRLGSAHIAGYSYDGKLAATNALVEKLRLSLGMDAPKLSLSAASPLTLARADSSADALRQLLAQRYRVAEDDRRLRGVVFDANPEGIAPGFDRLRKQYPVRRELAGSHVELTAETSKYASLVRALGASPSDRYTE